MNTKPIDHKIEFMAWDEENFEFVDMDNSDVQIELTKNGLILRVFNCGEGWNPDQGYTENPSWEVVKATFMQLTALRSINNEPIYNHMIVKNECDDLLEVDMFDYMLMCQLDRMQLEIVGNRFQHSELLEMCK